MIYTKYTELNSPEPFVLRAAFLQDETKSVYMEKSEVFSVYSRHSTGQIPSSPVGSNIGHVICINGPGKVDMSFSNQ